MIFAWQDAATILSIIFAGIFDGIATTKRDSIPSKVEDLIANNQSLIDWYNGGNNKYNPSNPFTADYWHTLKFGIIYSYCAAASFQVWKYDGVLYALMCFFILQALEGNVFRLFYHYVCPKKPRGNFWDFIKECNPFYNWHNKI